MTARNDIISIAILVLTLILLPSVPLGGTVDHETAFKVAGDGQIALTDVYTGESVSVKYRDASGGYSEKALEAIDHLFRCHGNDEEFPTSLKLIEFIDFLQDSFKVDNVNMVSGYRSPTYNDQVRKKLRRAAQDSFHKQGMAIDILLPGVGKKELAKLANSMNFGGIGTYRSSHYVHIDSGPVRSW